MQYVRYFWDANLQPHFKEEEEILFAPLSDDEMVVKAIEEHAAIKQGIEALNASPEQKLLDELTKFVDLLDKHVRYEERSCFHMESVLTVHSLISAGNWCNKVLFFRGHVLI